MLLRSLKPRIFARHIEKTSVPEQPTLISPSLSSPTEKTPQSDMTCQLHLNRKGKLNIDVPEGSAMLEPLLSKTVGHPAMTYQALDHSPERDRHVLLDNKGRLISLSNSPEGFIGITQSQQKPEWVTKTPTGFFSKKKQSISPTLSLSHNDAIVGGKKIPLPDKPLKEYLTDSTSDMTGRFRLHMKRLFRFNETSDKWEAHGSTTDKKTLLSRQANRAVWCVTNDKTLSPVSQPESEESLSEALKPFMDGKPSPKKNLPSLLTFDRKIEHFSVSRENQALVQIRNDDDKIQRLVWFENAADPDSRVNVILPHGYSCLKTAIFDKTLFALDYRGNLQCAPLPSQHDRTLHFDSGALNVRAAKVTEAIRQTVGDGFKIEDIGNVTDEKIHFVVKDQQERKHFIAVRLDHVNAQVESAWNISDAMVLDKQAGLPAYQPEMKNVIDLDRFGKLTVYDNRPYFLNERSGHWEMSSEEKSDRIKLDKLRAGLDGQPWMMKDDTIKKLKIRETTTKQSASSSVFILPQIKKSVSIDTAISGLNDDHDLVDFAAADQGHVITLSKNGDLNFHTGSANKILSKSALARSCEKEDLKVVSLAFNADRQLMMISQSGEVFSQSESLWENGLVNGIKIIPTPNDEEGHPLSFKAIHTLGPGRLAFEDNSGALWTHDTETWHPVNQDDISSSLDPMSENFNSLKSEEKTHRLAGVNVKTHATLGGMAKQSKVKTGFRERFDAFIFRPSLTWPRPLKIAAYGMQHSFSGREGLKPIYQMQSDLSAQLRTLQDERLPSLPRPLSDRLADFYSSDNSPAEKKLLSDLTDLNESLSASTTHFSKLIGKHYGLLDKELRPVQRPKFKKTQSGRFNLASSRTSNLTAHLNKVLKTYPLNKTNESGELIAQLYDQNIVLNQQKEVVPGGMQRDSYDDIGLIKSRLIHDAMTSRHLHQLVDDLEKEIPNLYEKEVFIQKMIERTAALRYGLWNDNPIKTITDQGFENHRTLEASYDAIRQMVKAFSKENHGVNITTRSVMQAPDQVALSKNLIDTLKSMETGESLSFSRSYGVNASVSSYFARALFVAGGAGARADRGYQMNLTRTETGVSVSFGRTMATAANLQMGLANNLFAEIDASRPTYLNEDHTISASKTILIGGGASLTAREARGNKLTLDVNESEIQPFIEQLVSGELDPIEMMNRGSNHQVDKIKSQDMTLSLSAAANIYVSLPFVSDDTPTVNPIGRFRATASAGLTLATVHRDRAMSVNSAGSGSTQSDNLISGLDRATIGAQLSAPFGPRLFSEGSKENFTQYVTPSMEVSASIDNRTEHQLKIALTNAPETTSKQIDAITSRLERHFTDNASLQLLAQINRKSSEGPNSAEKLRILDEHFSVWYPPEPAQKATRHHELTGHGQKASLLAFQSLVRSQQAFEEKTQLVTKAEYSSTFKNAHRLEHNSLCDHLARLTHFGSPTSQAERLRLMMKNDHHLSSFIESLRENPRVLATMTLELNAATRERLEKEWANKTLNQDQIATMLKDPRNVRIKSLNFTQTEKKSDGFASPNFMLGGSNAATVSMTEQLGSIQFSYPDDNDLMPVSYVLKGRIASRGNALSAAIDAARESGYVLKSQG